uniref:NADH-ubiquinone oxidoreductase chain 3 n=1 Tax=Oomorphoides metallicus TaxID=2576292 RepID=A0A4P8DP71_9CUCU|nr:NADH dehydrogenase subunit 3 [Oomorphoides metallicus]QCL18076.1 NADH dehydrogenase subunit 3 [Oomorphoides metallicus]
MLTLIKATMMIIFLMVILLMALNLVSKKTFLDREKSSPFECGFEPMTSARLPFSLQFFLIAIIFLIFDIEISLILPIIITPKISSIPSISITMALFVIILILGLYHEWTQGALNWSK